MSNSRAFQMLRKELGMKPRTKEADVLAFAISVIRTIKAAEKSSGGSCDWFLDTGGSIDEDDNGPKMVVGARL